MLPPVCPIAKSSSWDSSRILDTEDGVLGMGAGRLVGVVIGVAEYRESAPSRLARVGAARDSRYDGRRCHDGIELK